MQKFATLLSILLTLISVSQLSASECADLVKCVEHVSKLTGKKYFWDGSLKGDLKASSNFVLTAENADLLFTEILDTNGFARVPSSVPDTFRIIEARDIRYHSLPNIRTGIETEKFEAPAGKDYYYFEYVFKNNEQGQAAFAANNLRPFLSRYGRVMTNGNIMIVQDLASKLPVAFRIARGMDRALTKTELNRAREREKNFKKKSSKKNE